MFIHLPVSFAHRLKNTSTIQHYNTTTLQHSDVDNPGCFPTILGLFWAVLDYLRLNPCYLPPMHRHIAIHCRCLTTLLLWKTSTIQQYRAWLTVCSKGPDCWVYQKIWALEKCSNTQMFYCIFNEAIFWHLTKRAQKPTYISPKNLTIILTKICLIVYCINITF